MNQFFAFLKSVKLAVIVIVLLAIALAVGTVCESLYDTRTVQYLIYKAPWFQLILVALGIIIVAVAVDRWPWKRRHTPFVLAHIGIILLLIGSFITWIWGVDANLLIEEGQREGSLAYPDTRFVVLDGHKQTTVDIPWVPSGHSSKPIEVPEYGILLDSYLTHAEPSIRFSKAETQTKEKGPAVFLAIKTPFGAGEKFWLWGADKAWKSRKMGLAEIRLLAKSEKRTQKKPDGLALLELQPNNSGELTYFATSRKGEYKTGQVSLQNPMIAPGWMKQAGGNGLTFELKNWIPSAVNNSVYVQSREQYGERAPGSAIRMTYNGKSQWLGEGGRTKLKVAGNAEDSEKSGREILVGYVSRRVTMPFQLELVRFKIDHYQGTANPMEYSSLVRVHAKEKSTEPILISMNEPLDWEGYTFYQSSYIPDNPRPLISIFSVNKDPGRWLKYLGSILIVLGASLLFAVKNSKKTRKFFNPIIFLTLLTSFSASQAYADDAQNLSKKDRVGAGTPKTSWNFKEVGKIPIQSGGRVKPLDSFAREAVLFMSGSRKYKDWGAVDLLFSWITAPDFWEEENIVKINHPENKRQLVIDESRTFFSPKELMMNPVFHQYAQGLSSPNTNTSKRVDKRASPRDSEFKSIISRIQMFQATVSGQAWTVIPSPEKWKHLGETLSAGSAEAQSREAFGRLIQAYFLGDQKAFEKRAVEVKSQIEEGAISRAGEPKAIKKEISAESLYNHVRPFQVSWILYLFAGLIWAAALAMGANAKKTTLAAMSISVIAFSIQLAGIMVRVIISGRPPVSNMYETMIWVGLGVLGFGYYLYWRYRQKMIMAVACGVGAFSLIAADAAPAVMDPSIQPLVPVLRSNLWLTIHVLTITLSYAAFALGFGISNVSLYRFIAGKVQNLNTDAPLLNLNQITYRTLQFGVVLLAAGTILGGVWADYSWGRFWGWDPKETWALIALLVYLAVLHARFSGWLNHYSFAAWSVLCFLSVIMAWYGVNFVLGVGLHSYGFSSGGLAWVSGFSVVQILYVALSFFRYKQMRV